MNTGSPQTASSVPVNPVSQQDQATADSCKPKGRSKGHNIQPVPIAPTKFSASDAYDLFRDSRQKTFANADFSIEARDKVIMEEWQAAGFEERSAYFRKAWLNYETQWNRYRRQVSRRKEPLPEGRLEKKKTDEKTPLACCIVPDKPLIVPDKPLNDTSSMKLKEIYKDQDILVIEKPAGLTSTASVSGQDTVVKRLRAEHPGVHLPHRLDKATSGLMVVALNQKSASHLCGQFRDRKVHKIYTAEVWRKPDPAEGTVLLPLRPDDDSRRQCISDSEGKPSLTLYQTIKNHRDSCARVKLEPVTGRPHQLRVHMAAIGHPVVGCYFYGSKASATAGDRLHLHASELEFTHPVTGCTMRFESTPDF